MSTTKPKPRKKKIPIQMLRDHLLICRHGCLGGQKFSLAKTCCTLDSNKREVILKMMQKMSNSEIAQWIETLIGAAFWQKHKDEIEPLAQAGKRVRDMDRHGHFREPKKTEGAPL